MDSWTSELPGGTPLTGTERKLLASAAELVGDERVLAVVRGQTFVSPVLVPIIAPLLFVFVVKPRSVIVTDSSVITVEESLWMHAKVVRLVSRYAPGEVPIRLSRFGLKVGDDRRIFATIGSLPALEQAAQLGSAVGA